MAVLQDININVFAQPSEKRLRSFLVLSQNENGRTINFRILGSPLPSSCTATLSGTKPDGNVYSTSGIVAGNFVIVQEDIQMTAVAGVWDAKLDIVNGSHNIMTAIIRITVEGDVVAPGSVPSNSQLDGYIAQAKFYAEESRVEAYGSPLIAATKSAMIDKNRVYVYTGSESNMTAGNWYYWNGTAWVSGGVYNSAAVDTDTTLTLPDKAADAKAVGDAFSSVREDLSAEETRAKAEEERLESLFSAPTQSAINEWLNTHPEATTTVQDGAITPIKLAPALATTIGDSALNFNTSRVTMLRNNICGDANHYLQGGTYVSSTGHFVIAFAPISGSGVTSTILVELDKDFTTVIKRVSSTNYGHANDLTYNPNTDKIYVSSTGQASGSTYERKVLVVNASTLAIESGIAFANLVTAISYDEVNNVYYTVESVNDGRKVFKYDANFNLLENIGDAFLIDPVRQVGQCSVCYNGRFYYVTVSNYRNHTVWINTFGSDAKIWQIDNFAYYEPEILLEYGSSLYLFSIKSNTYIYIDRIGTRRTIYDRTEEYYLRGTLLITGADLNNVTNTGRYYMTEASASTIVNGPYTIMHQFSMDVLHIGYDGLCQIITVNNRMQFIRTFLNNAWTEWASLRSGKKYVGKTINTGNYYTAGFVTVAGRSIRFSIPMEIERDVNTASITGGSIRLLQGGNIVLNTSAILTTFDTVTVAVNDMGVSCEFLFETAPENIIHNEAIGIQLYSMVIQFEQ